ncbi:MAG: putative uridylyltransferase [Phycisphaerae bacterium]|nr:putative uridylyltransferase [Phycisphaerae bacterium]
MSIPQHYQRAKELLAKHGQSHLLRFWDDLDDARRAALLDDVEQLDMELLAGLIDSHVRNAPPLELPDRIRPPHALPNEPGDEATRQRYTDARALGEQLIRDGKVAALVVAGGQGTRLGFDGPKGAFPVSPLRNKPLFQLFAEQVRNAQRRYGTGIPWLIMTSPTNDAATRAFFAANGHFGLSAEQVLFFTQGTMPAFDTDGRILLAERHRLALSPDGHGGTLRALHRSGVLDRLADAGVTVLSYFQVDNPLVHVIDPLFIGLHAETRSQVSSKTIPKAGATERVGNFCVVTGPDGADRLTVIEYSDLPDELAHATGPDGRRLFDAGSIAIHLFDVAFVQALNAGGFGLPFHRALKKVPHIDDAGRPVEPAKPNGVKLETFVFDALPLAARTMIYTTRREEEFAPVKNAEGSDSPATARAAMVARAARWLGRAGVAVPSRPDGSPDATIEISPLLADSAEELASAIEPGSVVPARGAALYLEPQAG